ncbi:LysR family transcriptional regulator [Burkholderia territorii]|nr:LysR family transcriptional regulator [Burkholderia territorii]
MTPQIETRDMVLLQALAAQGSFSGAAEVLEQPVSSISRALKALEQRLQVALLVRTTRRMELTQAGRFLLERSHHVLQSLNDIEANLAQAAGSPSGLLRINTSASFMNHVLLPLVPRFTQSYPGITLELRSSDQIIELIQSQADVAIRIGAKTDSSLRAVHLGDCRRIVLASSTYLERYGLPQRTEELATHRLLGYIGTSSLNHWPLRCGQSDDYVIRPTLCASHGEMLRQLALAHQGIACLLDFSVATDCQRSDLVEVLPQFNRALPSAIHLVYYRRTPPDARIQAFIEFMRKQAATLFARRV